MRRLPPTRGLATLAGINQLTASRVLPPLQTLGAVVSEVGRGTFVRAARRGDARRAPGDVELAVLRAGARAQRRVDRIIGEIARHVEDPSDDPALGRLSGARADPGRRAAGRRPREAIERHGARAFQYGPIEGVSELREALAALGRRRGLDDDANSIVATTGARQALTLAARATLRPGDKVACESPTFMGIIEALRTAGAEILPVPVDEHGLDTGALEQLLRHHEIRLLATQPRLQNPTGVDLSPERRERLVELARQHGFFILEDAVYGDLRFEGHDPGPLRALAPSHVIYVDSLSKTVGPGLRAGWIAASGPVLDRIIGEKRRDDAHGTTLTQQATAGFLDKGLYPAQLARARSRYREGRDVLLAALESELGAIADSSHAGRRRPRLGDAASAARRRPALPRGARRRRDVRPRRGDADRAPARHPSAPVLRAPRPGVDRRGRTPPRPGDPTRRPRGAGRATLAADHLGTRRQASALGSRRGPAASAGAAQVREGPPARDRADGGEYQQRGTRGNRVTPFDVEDEVEHGEVDTATTQSCQLLKQRAAARRHAGQYQHQQSQILNPPQEVDESPVFVRGTKSAGCKRRQPPRNGFEDGRDGQSCEYLVGGPPECGIGGNVPLSARAGRGPCC